MNQRKGGGGLSRGGILKVFCLRSELSALTAQVEDRSWAAIDDSHYQWRLTVDETTENSEKSPTKPKDIQFTIIEDRKKKKKQYIVFPL